MQLNKELLKKFEWQNSKLLFVTKYWNKEETENLLWQFSEEEFEVLVWVWENRLKNLEEKSFDKEMSHFIGNLQTKEIKHIINYCRIIHSIDNVKQIKKIEEICQKSWNRVQVFIQINLDKDKEWWIKVEQIPEFIALIDETENISLVWFSAIEKSKFSKEEKEKEFDLLISLRNKFIPNGLISAWTSVDYEIALEKWIDIIRIWKSLVNN